MSQPSIDSLIASCDSISSAPALYAKLDAVMRDPDASLHTIGAVIAEDPGISARLLRLTNSSLYATGGNVENIDRALAIVGMKSAKELVLATSVVDAFGDLPNDLISMDMFWKHSIACACAARIIAQKMGVADVDRFYLMGLMHDIGRLVLYGKAPKIAVTALMTAKKDEALLYNVERDILGYDHADIGMSLLQQWHLPPAQVAAVGFHHRPSEAGEYIQEASITHFADIIANYTQFGSSGERFMPPLDPAAWDVLGLNEDAIIDIVGQIEPICQDATVAFFGDPKNDS